MLGRHIITSEAAPSAAGPYSHAVVVGDLVYCSGQVALDPRSGELLTHDGVQGEVRQCLDNLDAVARSAGVNLRQAAVRMTIYVVQLSTVWHDVNAAYGAWFGLVESPARVTIGVAELPLGARVEIDAVLCATAHAAG